MKHSISDLKRLQKVLEEKVEDKPGIRGVGISMNKNRTDYAFKILVDEEELTKTLPAKIEGVEVICEVTGSIKAL
jgi:hypothetical protein